jgi:hypothetical protein
VIHGFDRKLMGRFMPAALSIKGSHGCLYAVNTKRLTESNIASSEAARLPSLAFRRAQGVTVPKGHGRW